MKLLLLIPIILSIITGGLPEPIDPPIIRKPDRQYRTHLPITMKWHPRQPVDVAGTLVNRDTGRPAECAPFGCIVWFAEKFCGSDGHGCVFVLDSANSPSVRADEDGVFRYRGIPSGEYVIVITRGDPMTGYDIVEGSNGPRVWQIPPTAGVLELGWVRTWYE